MSTISAQARSEFGRYYTKPAFGQLLVELMHLRRPSALIDLGVGGGSLTLAATKQWSNLKLLTIDIDAASSGCLSKLLSSELISTHHHLLSDALEPSLAKFVRKQFGNFDAAVCNPPFTTPVWRKGFDEILEASGFSGCMPVLADADSALLFLSQALRLLGSESTLGIILPDSLVSGVKYLKFRQELLRRYRVDAVVSLPRRAFMHTEAAAHIVVVQKGVGGTNFVPIRTLVNGVLHSEIAVVPSEKATIRMDFNFHASLHGEPFVRQIATVNSLGKLATGIHRGSVEATASRLAGVPVFHTTDILDSCAGTWITLGQQFPTSNDRRTWAEPGDILVARVGRNLESKVVGVLSGCALLTDCVYRLRPPPGLGGTMLKQLSSDYGRAWLASRCSGVAARHLNLADLRNFPVHLEA